MSKDFRSSVRELAVKFADQLADQIVNLVQTTSMADVFASAAAPRTSAAPAPQAPARKGRRGRGKQKGSDSSGTLATIADLLAKNSGGLRAEQIRDALSLDKPTVTKAITLGLESKKLTKKGEKRATTYFVK